MLVEKVERNGLTGKMFSTKIGFYYKNYYKRKMVSCSYTYLSDINLCRDRMLDELDNFDKSKLERKVKKYEA
ncbi:MAG: hypothetical protein J6S85_18355 [Methanobrevibacter sp.]|nr:hypothetical protein [Methanobrevibacter sp.]